MNISRCITCIIEEHVLTTSEVGNYIHVEVVGCNRGTVLLLYDDVAAGLLYYVAQSFLLAGSIFGLDQYIRIIKNHYHEHNHQ